MKRIIALILALIAVLSCCGAMAGCEKKQSAKEKYGMDYYDRADGKRIWYNTR